MVSRGGLARSVPSGADIIPLLTTHGPLAREVICHCEVSLVSLASSRSSRRQSLSIRGLSGSVAQAKWREISDACWSRRRRADGRARRSPATWVLLRILIGLRTRLLNSNATADMHGPFLDMVWECVQCRAEKDVRLHKFEMRSLSPADTVQKGRSTFVGLKGVCA